MKKILSFVLILAVALSLSSCHKIRSSVKFYVDGELVEKYSVSSANI